MKLPHIHHHRQDREEGGSNVEATAISSGTKTQSSSSSSHSSALYFAWKLKLPSSTSPNTRSQPTSSSSSAEGLARKAGMAVMIAVVVDGLGTLVRAIWGLQDRRFSVVSSAATSLCMAFLLCFLSGVHRHGSTSGGLGLAWI